MSDLETRLAEALRLGAEGAPPAIGLADGARVRARRRRRTTLGVVAAAVALAIGVPTAVLAWPDRAVDMPDGASASEPGLRWESWHGVTVQVPDDWGHGSLTAWCGAGGAPTARVQTPGADAPAIGCTPASTYGLTFQSVDGDDFAWPVVHQDGGGWPAENAVGGRSVAGVLVTVAAPTATQAQAILDSARPIDGHDPNGCAETLALDPTAPTGGMAVCRYDADGALEQSELLTGEQVTAAETALEESAPGPQRTCAEGPSRVVRMTSSRVDATAAIGSCHYLVVDGSDRRSDSEVFYWALSPGFTGPVSGVPLPLRLRQE